MSAAAQTPGGAASAFSGWTIGMLVLMAVGAAVIVIGMIYGNRLARQRHRAQEAAGERAEEAGVEPVDDPSAVVEDPALKVTKKSAEERAAGDKTVPESAPASTAAARSDAPKAEEKPVANAPTPTAKAEPPAAKPAPATDPASPAEPPSTDTPAIDPAIAGALALTTIKGLGPKVAALLAEQGVTRVDQIAALNDADATALDIRLGNFAGRMARDRWIDQAKLLASGDTAAYEAEFGKLG